MYNDAANHATIGYGHLVHYGPIGTNDDAEASFLCGVTREIALELLAADLVVAEDAVNTLVRTPLRQAQFDALVSFVFNVGRGAFARSTLLARLNGGFCCVVPLELRKWTKAGGRHLAGLLARRNGEGAMWCDVGGADIISA